MKIIAGQVFARWAEVEEFGVPFNTIHSGVKRARTSGSESWQNITDPADKRVCLINWATIPAATVARYNLPSVDECRERIKTAEVKAMANKAEFAAVEREVLATNLAEKVEVKVSEMDELRSAGLPEPAVKAYARLAGWMRVAIGVKGSIALYRKVWKDLPTALGAILDQMALEYRKGVLPQAVINHPAVLQRKMKAFEAEGVLGIVSKKYGNENRKVMDELHEALLLKLVQDSRKFDLEYIYQQYCEVLNAHGKQPVSISRVRQVMNNAWLAKAAFKNRHGAKEARALSDGYIKREKPRFALSLVAGDGLKLGEIVKIPAGHRLLAGSKKANRAKSFKGLLWIWLWFDTHSGAVIGHEFGIEETGRQIRNAMKTAIRNCGDRVPMSVYVDKMWTQREETRSFLDSLSIKCQPKMPWNPKESPAERFNKEINKFFRRQSENWVNPFAAKSIEFLRKGDVVEEKDIRSIDEVMRLVRDVIDWYNHDVRRESGTSRWTDMIDNINPEADTLSAVNRAQKFGRSTKGTIDRGKLKITIGSHEYFYDVENEADVLAQLRKRERVRVWIDEEDLDEVYLFRMEDENDAEQDEYLGTASLIVAPQMAQVERLEADKEAQALQKNRKKATQQRIDDLLETTDEILDRYGVLAMLPEVNQHMMKKVLTSPEAQEQRKRDGIATEPAQGGKPDRFSRLANS